MRKLIINNVIIYLINLKLNFFYFDKESTFQVGNFKYDESLNFILIIV